MRCQFLLFCGGGEEGRWGGARGLTVVFLAPLDGLARWAGTTVDPPSN